MTVRFPQRWTSSTDPAKAPGILQNALDFLADLFDKFTAATAKGTATVTNGNVAVAVAFATPITSPAVVVTPLSDPGGRFWTSARTSSGFTINLGVAAPVAGVVFDWIAKGA
jgi:hypothetical protein